MNVCYLWSVKAVSDKMKQLINSSGLRYHTILGVSCYIEEAYSYFVLCYLTYLSVVAFNGVGGVYRLRIAGVYWKCSVRRSQLSHHDFMTMGYVSPHLLSSVSNCVSAVSLLTAPYTVLRSRRNLLLMLTANVLDRVAYLMDNTELDTCIGEYALYGIREAFQTINAAYQYIPDTSVLKIA